ncbi:AAA family ATPase [Novosphingobium sp. FSY-8]|uniref:AAA family ATPase n=1 Tax=Novosphingobium ovatum TaxID=1908523 RepID=A0ABW9XCL0_9SPHN|nr:AAA family ATPase [Novosphingobium ovatum]NBC36240.1 AAA family ATPase [Novosphingobium ovatum]
MTHLRGHDAAWREWRAAMAGSRMHHGWILSGPMGIGKAQFARAAAAELVAEPGIAQPPAQSHPDILIPEHPPANKEEEKKRDAGDPYETKRSIPIDEIRRIQHRLTTRPTLGSRRVVIIDPADDLEKNAVNALLKSLEEPPVGTFFLLVTHRIGRLLPTIRSRCRVLRFQPLDARDVDAVLADAAPQADAATRAAAIAAAGGSPGVALEFVEEDLGRVHAAMQAIVQHGDPDLTLRADLMAAFGQRPPRRRIVATLDLARSVLSGALRNSPPDRQARIIEAHAAIVTLAAQAPIYNFDPGMLAMEIGALLAQAAMPREASYR